MIAFYMNSYKVKKIDEAAYEYGLTFLETNGRGADGNRRYAFFELTGPLSYVPTPVSSYWSPAEAYAVLKNRGNFSHIKREGSNRRGGLFE